MTILPADAALPDTPPSKGVSLLSFNVLLPNSVEGWWVRKYYACDTPEAHWRWPHRRALIRDLLLGAAADVVCVQEASGESFEEDFAFMREAGYEALLHKKFRFRNATFWHEDRWQLEAAHHSNRVLVTTLRARDDAARVVHVVNVHLTGGPKPAHRLRQLSDALDRVRKEALRLGEDPAQTATLVCGDFNTRPGDSAARELLVEGAVDARYREPGFPDRALTKRGRSQALGSLRDVYADAFEARPPTFAAPDVWPRLVDAERGRLQPAFLEALRAMYARFAGPEGFDAQGVTRWARAINGDPTRGSQARAARALLETRPALTFEDFVGLYAHEIRAGRLWSVRYDLEVCGHPLELGAPHLACLDYLYHTRALQPVAVRHTLTEALARRLERGDAPPDGAHPSDHLPIGAAFRWRA